MHGMRHFQIDLKFKKLVLGDLHSMIFDALLWEILNYIHPPYTNHEIGEISHTYPKARNSYSVFENSANLDKFVYIMSNLQGTAIQFVSKAIPVRQYYMSKTKWLE